MCSAVLLREIWPTALLSAQLSQISEQNVVQSGLCLVGLRDVLGSSFLDLQSHVFSELTSLHMSRLLASVRKIRRSLALLFTLLGSTLWLFALRSPSWGLCNLRFTPFW